MKHILFVLLSSSALLQAQMPSVVSVPIAIDSPDLRDGDFDVTIRWYDDALQGMLYGAERTTISITQGRSTIVLGNASPLPQALLESGRAWITVQFTGYAEPNERYVINPAAFSQVAGFAMVAASIDPRATGIVTSLNELAGAIELASGSGISIERSGNTLVINQRDNVEEGIVRGDGINWTYRVQLSNPKMNGMPLTCGIESDTDIAYVSAQYDPATQTYLLMSSAILTTSEIIRWHVGHR
ncbi:MAG: hypothetical protein ACK5GI_01325 [Ignavibacteria bacterium]|jgi:hypothetical protein